MGTARWCPPEKHGWQFHRGVEEIAPTVVLRGMKGRGAGVAPDSPDGIHEDKNGRKRVEATHAPLSFPIFLLPPGQIQPSSYLRLGRGFQVVSGRPTSRRSALNHPISSPLLLLDKDPSQRWAASVVSKRYVSSNDSEGKVSMLISARFSCWSPNDSASSLYWAVARGFDV